MKMNFTVLSKLLQSTRGLLLSGYAAFAFSFILLLQPNSPGLYRFSALLFCVLLLAAHHYLSMRVLFDARLLDALAQSEQPLHEITADLDQSLIQLKLMPQAKAGRGWTERFQGCIRLFKAQACLLFMQYLVLMCLAFWTLTIHHQAI
ncbi:hypothetical protein BEN74_18460 [Acinetobacter sp. WCHAc010034]|uniref:hypothetical protein n=1 Tax=Acinetobacter sp. WCHAc010034 TaxID=1879049 RepID=UPI00083ACBF8|nr:hypothetical protein [Acinetobacter sp. WCHAc010034]AYA04572.1 hypothetical protein BEN74_18460 [Acinetobacter sp. WCHAc010034]